VFHPLAVGIFQQTFVERAREFEQEDFIDGIEVKPKAPAGLVQRRRSPKDLNSIGPSISNSIGGGVQRLSMVDQRFYKLRTAIKYRPIICSQRFWQPKIPGRALDIHMATLSGVYSSKECPWKRHRRRHGIRHV
jgi:hypothetical protein